MRGVIDGVAFCPRCSCNRQYFTLSFPKEIRIKGVNVLYWHTDAKCYECENLMYVPEINDSNVRARDEEYLRARFRSIVRKYGSNAVHEALTELENKYKKGE